MKNEVLAKILCHNICCLIQAQFELGLGVTFWQQAEAHLPKPDLGKSA